MIATLPLTGPAYSLDNGTAFDTLKSYLLAGPAWPWIQHYDTFRNGREAWKVLTQHYGGTSSQNHIKSAAYVAFSKARYDGEQKELHLRKLLHHSSKGTS